MQGVLESILLNTINPFFHIWMVQGPKGVDGGSEARPRPRLLVRETWRSAAGDQTGSRTRENGPTSQPFHPP